MSNMDLSALFTNNRNKEEMLKSQLRIQNRRKFFPRWNGIIRVWSLIRIKVLWYKYYIPLYIIIVYKELNTFSSSIAKYYRTTSKTKENKIELMMLCVAIAQQFILCIIFLTINPIIISGQGRNLKHYTIVHTTWSFLNKKSWELSVGK